MGEVLANARRALPALYDCALPPQGRLTCHTDLADAVSGADWVQESVPETLALKHRILPAIRQAARPDAVIGSSTSGLTPSELNAPGTHAIVAHPFNPVYRLPFVELVGDQATCAHAADIVRGIGMYPLIARKEIDAHIAFIVTGHASPPVLAAVRQAARRAHMVGGVEAGSWYW